MKEVTVKEFATAFEGELVEVSPADYCGIAFEMSKARIEYDSDNQDISFTTGNYNHDGIGTVVIKEDHIESIKCDETSNEYVVSFTSCVPDITVSKFKSLEELEKERTERKKQ